VEFQASSRPGGTTFDSQRELFGLMVGALLGTTPGGEAELRALVDPRLHDLLEGVEPTAAPGIWSTRVQVNLGDRTTAVDAYIAPVHDCEGRGVGGTTVAKPGGRGAIMSMLALGDGALFDRMLPLTRPARRPSAILFADLESSTALARRRVRGWSRWNCRQARRRWDHRLFPS
jgi:hypothetical protein